MCALKVTGITFRQSEQRARDQRAPLTLSSWWTWWTPERVREQWSESNFFNARSVQCTTSMRSLIDKFGSQTIAPSGSLSSSSIFFFEYSSWSSFFSRIFEQNLTENSLQISFLFFLKFFLFTLNFAIHWQTLYSSAKTSHCLKIWDTKFLRHDTNLADRLERLGRLFITVRLWQTR